MSIEPAADDPFGTADLRRVVLDAWAASPARFREDANAEESLALGGYADRTLIELAANAADAARLAGVPGELLVRLVGNELRVANTGAAVTAAGVASLASLRASAKRDGAAGNGAASGSGNRGSGSIGHFGVGFTAVLALTDGPRIASEAGGIRFDRAETASAIVGLGVAALNAEVAARAGNVPALRLPWPWCPPESDPIPAGFVTEIRLPLRDPAAAERVLRADRDVGQYLLWALPDLHAVTVLDRRLTRTGDQAGSDGIVVMTEGAVAQRFRCVTRQGSLPAALFADRPIEERGRTGWRISWVLPLDADDRPAPAASATIGSPTPTDEPLTVPAMLIGTFPVDDTRRRLAPGPLLDALLEHAVQAYLDLVSACEPADRSALVPRAGFPAGPVDAALRDALVHSMSGAPVLVTATGEPVLPIEACLLPGVRSPAAELIGQAVPGLVSWPDRAAGVEALRAIGVRTIAVSDATAALAALDRPAQFWHAVYDALEASDIEDLADLPVPRMGGGTMIGARGVLLPEAGSVPAELLDRAIEVAPRLRIAAPGAAHPLLLRLGGVPADATALLSDPAVHQAIRGLHDDLADFDPEPDRVDAVANLVLELIALGGRTDPALLAQVLLTDADDGPWPAGELLLPDAPLADVLDSDADLAVVGAGWVRRYGPDLLMALGVRSGFAVLTVPAPPGPDVELPDVDGWWEFVGHAHPLPETFCALADLDLVAERSWPAALRLIAADRRTRDALAPDGWPVSYSAWWLRRYARIDGAPPAAWRTAAAGDLDGLFDVLPVDVDPAVAALIGVRASLDDAIAEDPSGVLDRLCDSARSVPAGRVGAITGALVDRLARGVDGDLPAGARTLTGDVVPAETAMVLDLPWLAQVLPLSVLVPGGRDPSVAADVLELDLASARVRVQVLAGPEGRAAPAEAIPGWQAAVQAVGARALDDGRMTVDPALTVMVDPALTVTVDGGDPVPVRWWGDGDRMWIDGSPAAVGRAVAWLAGQWSGRHRAIAAAAGDGMELAEHGLD